MSMTQTERLKTSHQQPYQELLAVEQELEYRRQELAAIQRECCLLREQRRQLIQSLEGQLDLFRDQVASSEQLLKTLRSAGTPVTWEVEHDS